MHFTLLISAGLLPALVLAVPLQSRQAVCFPFNLVCSADKKTVNGQCVDGRTFPVLSCKSPDCFGTPLSSGGSVAACGSGGSTVVFDPSGAGAGSSGIVDVPKGSTFGSVEQSGSGFSGGTSGVLARFCCVSEDDYHLNHRQGHIHCKANNHICRKASHHLNDHDFGEAHDCSKDDNHRTKHDYGKATSATPAPPKGPPKPPTSEHEDDDDEEEEEEEDDGC
ncbi:uncharacterized protein AB675_9983 [Cyphellophora attinorum]|uniref:Endo-1,3(4)-beta-glucanase 1 carbohydrate binding domain-containing protein n=1 Tax=Cyphellophora attinorum TaxID=1664694 RepID=A0A0N0NJA5_9EURO|nr:uncharacterized protein AB675_9983 [Phialophora attinorum]KPI36688.1 hypothetical protein AB675_9983 [Phialophora attinorum]